MSVDELRGLLARVDRCATTMANDDRSERETEGRARYCERMIVLLDVREHLTALIAKAESEAKEVAG